MGPIYLTSFGVPPNTSIASSRARSRLTCQCRSAGTSQLAINLNTAKAGRIKHLKYAKSSRAAST